MALLDLGSLSSVGDGLHRPECVLCTANGRTYAADWGGGVTVIEPDGSQLSLMARNGDISVRPNGIALMEDGSFLLAHLGEHDGGVWRLSENGDLSPFAIEVDGITLPPTNFVYLDHLSRVWITVSTRQIPRAKGYNKQVADGFIALVDDTGPRIVADDLGYTNECLIHPDGRRLFVNETFSRRLTCYDIAADGSLSNRKTVMEFGPGTFPDGLCFDVEGGVWIASVVSNRLLRLAPDGSLETIIEDNDPDHLAWVEEAYQTGTMGRPHLDDIRSAKLRSISNIAFGGPDLKTGYLGCLLGDTITTFASPIAGHPLAHWNFSGPCRGTNPAQEN
jgi:sugar lactone lactonase YvrE